MSDVFETQRLIVREIRDDDLPTLVSLNADPDVMQYIAPPQSEAETLERIARIRADYARRPGLGWWVAQRRGGGEVIGMTALKPLSDDLHAALTPLLRPLVAGTGDGEVIEFGWRLHKAHWGRGYATELGRALAERAFSVHGLSRVFAVALAENRASCRVIEKCGLREVGRADVRGRAARLFMASAGPAEPTCG